jgi:hypothetical protein
MKMTSEEERYNLSDWVPPWLDNGDCMSQIIDAARGIDNPISWQVICHLLVQQLQVDLKIAREVNFMFNEDINDEALPYQWGSESRKKTLQSLWDKIVEAMNDPIDDEDE